MLIVEKAETTASEIKEGVVHNVKICGFKSKNGRTYLKEALAKAVPLYENAPVYINHSKSDKERPYQDRIGVIKNVSFDENEGVKGDCILNEGHDCFKMVKFDLEQKTNKVGFSHSVNGLMNDKKEVYELIEVYSVDIVDNPAVNSNFYENVEKSYEQKWNDLADALNKRINMLEAKLNEKQEEPKFAPVQNFIEQKVNKDDWMNTYFVKENTFKFGGK